MLNIGELKRKSKEQLRGNLTVVLLMAAAIFGMNLVINLIPVLGGIVSFFITPLFTFNMVKAYLDITKGDKPEVKDLLNNTDMIVKIVMTTYLISIFITLWSMLLFIPGLIKTYSYSQALYILAENPQLTPLQAIGESRRIMDGNKMNLFSLILSFIGWIILGMVTFGLAYIYVIPYISIANTNFYNEIKTTPHYMAQ